MRKFFSKLPWIIEHFCGTWLSIGIAYLFFLSSVTYAATTYSVQNVPEMRLKVRITASQTTGIQISPPSRNGVDVTYPTTSGGVLEFKQGIRTEHIYYSSATVNATTKVITLTGTIIRDLDWNHCTSYVTNGGGEIFTPGAVVRLVDDCRLYNLSLKTDVVKTMVNSGAIISTQTTQPWLFPNSVTTAQRDAFTYGNDKPSIIYNSTLGTMQYRSGGAWINFGSGSTVNATESAKGSVELGTIKDQTGATLTGETGAPTVVQTRYLTNSGGTTQYGRVPTIARQGILSGSLLCTGNQYANGGRQYCSGTGSWTAMPAVGNVFFQCSTSTGSAIISGTAAETDLGPNCNLTGSLLSAGDELVINYSFISKNAGGSNSATVKLKFGSTVILSLGPINPVNATPYTYAGTARIRFRTVGSSAQIIADGVLHPTSTGSTTSMLWDNASPNPSNPIAVFDMTTNPKLIMSGTMGSATAGNTMQMTSFSAMKLTTPTQTR